MIDDLRSSFRALWACLGRRSWLLGLALTLALAIPLYFIYSTHLVWEDFFITYRYSENLARGKGMVYTAGDRVYGFTSPLNMLLPALFCFLTRARDFLVPLWLFRMVSLAGFLFALVSITTVLIGDRTLSRARLAAACLFPLLAALEIKTTAFLTSGQETGLVLCFLAPTLALAALGWTRHWALGGVLWGALMYSRPDGCIYILAIAISGLAFGPGPRRATFSALAKSALICAVIYLPWFLFTSAYFGSPVPHTITAKYGIPIHPAHAFRIGPTLAFLTPWAIRAVFSPIYDGLGPGPGAWPRWVHAAATGFQLLALFYWLIPTRDRLGRMASLVSLLLQSYLLYVALVAQSSPWYYPPLAFVSLIALVSAFSTLAGSLRRRFAAGACAALGFSGLFVLLGFTFFASLAPLRFKAEVIDWGGRRSIGLWLKGHVRADEAVYLEPLGYIGYFSQARMMDWPGLVSPEVVDARRLIGPRLRDGWGQVAELLRPAWIVARPIEADLMRRNAFLSGHYRLERVFDASAKISGLGSAAFAPGMGLIYDDVTFGIYRRVD